MISQTEIQNNKSGQLFVDSQCSTIKCDVSYTVYYLHQVRKFSASSLLRVFVCLFFKQTVLSRSVVPSSLRPHGV